MNSLVSLRKRIGLTQMQIADKLKVSQASVAMWENGESFPRVDKLPALAKILQCSIDDLFVGVREGEAD